MTQSIQPEQEELKEVDFDILDEDWTRFILEDGTVLRVRLVISKILRSKEVGETGYPNFESRSGSVISALVPPNLIRKPTPPEQVPGKLNLKELKFQSLSEGKWQRYRTSDGYILLFKVALTKAFKAMDYYNTFGEPVYQINFQTLHNAERP